MAASGTSLGGIILKMLEAFALFAIATSFLGAGLGLFDYMADLCGFDNSRLGRTKTMLITFVPPMIGGIIWPDGFLPAIGWAGLAASIWSVIVPALLLRASRRKFQASLYRVPAVPPPCPCCWSTASSWPSAIPCMSSTCCLSSSSSQYARSSS